MQTLGNFAGTDSRDRVHISVEQSYLLNFVESREIASDLVVEFRVIFYI